jgi:hypothetical protein
VDAVNPADQPLYARIDYIPFQRFWALNANLDRRFKQDPASVSLDMLEAALTADCFDTALGLARYVLVHLDDYAPKLRARALSRALDALLAHGLVEQAHTALLRHFDVVRLSDELFATCSRLMAPAGTIVEEFVRLPSGQLNVFYLDGMLSLVGDRIIGLLFSNSEQFQHYPEHYLIIANHFALKRDGEGYRHFLNVFLRACGVELVERISLDRNALAGLVMQRPPRSQDADTALVSVIMAARNTDETILYSMRSALEQTHTAVELLVCDDASKDGTLELAAKHFGNDPRVRLFRSTRPQGPYNIRNALIEQAKGEYLTFHDADDFALPSRLARQLAFLREHPDALAACAQFCRVTPEGRFVFFKDQSAVRMASVSLLARREIFLRYGPYDPVLYGGDSALIERIRAAHGSKAVPIMPTPVMLALWSENSLTRCAGSEVTETGLRGPTRREYAEGKSRERFETVAHSVVSPRDWPNRIEPSDVVPVAAARSCP